MLPQSRSIVVLKGMTMNLHYRSTSALLAVGSLLAVGALTACSVSVGTPALSKANLESQALTSLQGAYDGDSQPSAVACPGDLEGTVGVTMLCDVTFDQGIGVATITVESVTDGLIKFDITVAPVTTE